MNSLYIDRKNLSLNHQKDALLVFEHEQRCASIPLRLLERIIIASQVQLNASTLGKLGSLGSSFWLILLALAVIVFGANTGVATYEGSRLSGAGTGAADLQVLSQQLANQGREAVAGNAEAFKSFKGTQGQIDSTIATLKSRFGDEGAVAGPLERLTETCAPLSKNAQQLTASEPAGGLVARLAQIEAEPPRDGVDGDIVESDDLAGQAARPHLVPAGTEQAPRIHALW